MSCRLVSGGKAVDAQSLSWNDQGQVVSASVYQEPVLRLAAPAQATQREQASQRQIEQRVSEAYQRGLREGDSAAGQRMAQQVAVRMEQLGRSIEQLALHRGKIQR